MTAAGLPCMLLRGGTSKGAYFLASDLPADPGERDDLLLRVMGSPDPRQIDGLGGGHPLTSKVAVVAPSEESGVDVDYLFLQVVVDQAVVSDRQNCGNILAGVGPFAIERGLVSVAGETTSVRIRLRNTGSICTATVATPGGSVDYDGDLAIDGVPGTAGAIPLDFEEVAGSSTGGLFPTGNLVDTLAGTRATCVDGGMPTVILRADDLGVTGDESPEELESDATLTARVERIRLAAGRAMGLGDVADATMPKMVLASAPVQGGAIATRSFIPHRVHTSIGVLGAISAAAGLIPEGTVAHDLVSPPGSGDPFALEHPTGRFAVEVVVDQAEDGWTLTRAAALRTARKIFEGAVFPRPRT
ncbi:4-oxalomesaconate tautomerase [Microbacterium sp. G2-8]|uniref:4-oxalomesaconate tautomerase n=1 Tax=Microbacterium sp. G2-8 TaxID=2842454 RepID=UPI001C8948C5|nr:4-oxalomesaconate tautomerase [Microbacterium sp. G2-8]